MAGALMDLLMDQGGVATRAQLEGLFSRARLATLIRGGRLLAVRPGVYTLPPLLAAVRADLVRSAAIDVAAAVVGKTGVGSHFSAAVRTACSSSPAQATR